MIPLVPVYAAGVALRSAGLYFGLEPVRRLRWPVVSVGNLSAGGTGKTPFTIALARLLHRQGTPVDRKSTRLNSSHFQVSRMPSSA